MLGPGRYLLGVFEILLLAGAAGAGAWRLRRWLLPRFEGAPAVLATLVLAAALLIWAAELLGSFGAFEPVPYLALVVVVGVGLWRLLPGSSHALGPPEGGPPHPYLLGGVRGTSPRRDGSGWVGSMAALVALVVAVVAVLHFGAGVKTRLSTGMTGFDSTWYHGPFATGFFQSGDTWDLHFIAPQFLAWFYPANAEIFHAVGMLACGRDLLSPLLNLGWFVGCLLACWCIGRPFRVGPWSLALGAIALSVPALADQAGEARNDVVGIFFLLAAAAIAVNAPPAGDAAGNLPRGSFSYRRGRFPAATGPAGRSSFVVGLAAGLAAGTKLNFLLPAAVLVLGIVLAPGRRHLSPVSGDRRRGRLAGKVGPLVVAAGGALAGGGYWYLRNLAHVGNPLPWIHHLGPITLPAPEQGLGGREAHSVLGYLSDGTVWSDWFLPGLHHGLWILWPLLLAGALGGLILAILQFRGSFVRDGATKEPRNRTAAVGGEGQRPDAAGGLDARRQPDGPPRAALALAGLAGLAAAVAWLISPTSASGPDGMPRGFESGLRYLAPALVLGLALLPTAAPFRRRLAAPLAQGPLSGWLSFSSLWGEKLNHASHRWSRGRLLGAALAAALAVAAIGGYPIQRHYLENRYRQPTFTAPGLNAAFAWARDVSDARIATTSTRQYPLFGTDLSNRVQYLGFERPHGGFEAPATCPAYRRLLNAGNYDYVVATYDRVEPGTPTYPPQARWTKAPGSHIVLRQPPTVIFKLTAPLDPSACGSAVSSPSREPAGNPSSREPSP